jgi:MATE family multidrug resistance protein
MITAILHLWWCFLFVNILHWDVLGVSLATFLTFFSNFIIVTAICYRDKELEGMYFFITRESFNDVWDYLKIGIPNASMVCLEWWFFELLALLAGYISI